MCPDGPVGPQGPGVAPRFTFVVHSTLLPSSSFTPNTDTDINTAVAPQVPRGCIPFHLHHTLNSWPHPQTRLSIVILVRKHLGAKMIWIFAPTPGIPLRPYDLLIWRHIIYSIYDPPGPRTLTSSGELFVNLSKLILHQRSIAFSCGRWSPVVWLNPTHILLIYILLIYSSYTPYIYSTYDRWPLRPLMLCTIIHPSYTPTSSVLGCMTTCILWEWIVQASNASDFDSIQLSPLSRMH